MPYTQILQSLIDNNQRSLLILKELYLLRGLSEQEFNVDRAYLEQAFSDMTTIWLDNFQRIKDVKYIMIAEAPLWGANQSYIYNELTPFTQFFYKSDLEKAFDNEFILESKRDFLNKLNEMGFLIIDISPFALNTQTKLNYGVNTETSSRLTNRQYRDLVQDTMSHYFNLKLDLALTKRGDANPMVFFRYARVERAFKVILSPSLQTRGLINQTDELENIGKQGGGIDVENGLKPIVNP